MAMAGVCAIEDCGIAASGGRVFDCERMESIAQALDRFAAIHVRSELQVQGRQVLMSRSNLNRRMYLDGECLRMLC